MHSIDANVLELRGKPLLTSSASISSARTRKQRPTTGPIDADTPTTSPEPLIAQDAIRGQVSSSSQFVLVLDELQAPAMPCFEEPSSGISDKVRLAPRFDTPPSPMGCADAHVCWDVNAKPHLQDSTVSITATTSSTHTYPVFICRRPLDNPDICFIETASTNTFGSLSNTTADRSSCPDMSVLNLEWVGDESERGNYIATS